jgi:hypothetical protein
VRAAFIGCVAALAVATAWADTRDDAVALITDCSAKTPRGTTGLDALEQACPGLGRSLDAAGLGPLLTDASGERLTPATLSAALALLGPRPDAGTLRPDPVALGPVLKELEPRPAPASWWQRLREWLHAHLFPAASDSGTSWFGDWLRNVTVPEALSRVLLIALLVTIVAGALLVVYRELRAYGVFDRGQREARAAGAGVGGDGGSSAPTLASVLAAPAGARGALLFELLLRALAASGRVSGSRQRTHRELRREPPFADAAERARFAALAAVAEEQLFAATPVALERLAAALAGGAALYESLRPGGGARP